MSKLCHNCHTELANDVHYCTKCGTKQELQRENITDNTNDTRIINNNPSEKQEINNTKQSEQKNPGSPMIMVLALIIAFSIVGCCVYFITTYFQIDKSASTQKVTTTTEPIQEEVVSTDADENTDNQEELSETETYNHNADNSIPIEYPLFNIPNSTLIQLFSDSGYTLYVNENSYNPYGYPVDSCFKPDNYIEEYGYPLNNNLIDDLQRGYLLLSGNRDIIYIDIDSRNDETILIQDGMLNQGYKNAYDTLDYIGLPELRSYYPEISVSESGDFLYLKWELYNCYVVLMLSVNNSDSFEWETATCNCYIIQRK